MTDTAPQASAPNPFARLAAAGRGDMEAQRGYVLEALDRLGVGGIDLGDFEDARERAGALIQSFDLAGGALLIEALVFARMAAAQGDARDRDRLIALLSLAALLLPAEIGLDMVAEQIARMSLRAEEANPTDHEAADLMVNFFTEEAPPEAVAKAHLCRQLLIESGAN